MQTGCNFGVLPLLSRAWAAVDANLFLWNFKTNKDLAYYDSISSTILKIELVNVRPGMFEVSTFCGYNQQPPQPQKFFRPRPKPKDRSLNSGKKIRSSGFCYWEDGC